MLVALFAACLLPFSAEGTPSKDMDSLLFGTTLQHSCQSNATASSCADGPNDVLITTGFLKSSSVASDSAGRPPHILLILFDDLGWNDLGSFSGVFAPRTPFMDSLMAEGIKLRRFYVQQLCSPTRGALFTGRYPARWGGQVGVASPGHEHWVNPNEVWFTQRLQAAGYRTLASGKWHLGHATVQQSPVGRGFDEFYGLYHGGGDHWQHTQGRVRGGAPGSGSEPWVEPQILDLHHQTSNPYSHHHLYGYNGTHSTDFIADRAVEMVEAHDVQQPLFLYLAFQAAHLPNQVAPKWESANAHIRGSMRRTFAGMITHMDAAVSRVVAAFKRRQMWKDTFTLAFADNGGNVPQGSSNWPLRGAKRSPWEGGTRVPAFLHSLRFVPDALRGKETHGLMHVVDVFPTLLSLAGADVRTALPLDGMDMFNTMTGRLRKSPRVEVLYALEGGAPRSAFPMSDKAERSYLKNSAANAPFVFDAIRVGDYKLVQGFPGRGDWYYPDPSSCFSLYEQAFTQVTAVANLPQLTDYSKVGVCLDLGDGGQKDVQDGKITKMRDLKQLWLFNVETDPEERHDLSSSLPGKVAELRAALQRYINEAHAPHLLDREVALRASRMLAVPPAGERLPAVDFYPPQSKL